MKTLLTHPLIPPVGRSLSQYGDGHWLLLSFLIKKVGKEIKAVPKWAKNVLSSLKSPKLVRRTQTSEILNVPLRPFLHAIWPRPAERIFTLLLFLTLCVGVQAQKRLDQYTTSENEVINSGDTVRFLEGSLGGAFDHVFYMVGKVQKRRATFTSGFYSELVIDHFLSRREADGEVVYAVMKVPNKPKWYVRAQVDKALAAKEIEIKRGNNE